MVFGIITLLVCIVLLLKYPARRLKLKKLDKVLKRIHKPAGACAVMIVMIHLIATIDVWDTRSLMVVATGAAAGAVLVMMAVGYLFRKKTGKNWLLFHKAGVAAACLLILLHIAGYYVDYQRYQDKIASIDVNGVTARGVRDGTYCGEYDAGFIYAKVAVEVENGQILKLTLLEHDNERGAKAEAVAEDIAAKQITKVDAVSGATNSSMVIMKAAENALTSGTWQEK